MSHTTTIDTIARRGLAIASSAGGLTHVPVGTPLTRLNFFDGRFLRADDLTMEQAYVRALAALVAQGGGAGVVSGFDVDWESGPAMTVGSGLAITPEGRVLFLPEDEAIPFAELIERSGGSSGDPCGDGPGERDCAEAPEAPPGRVGHGADCWILTVGPAEALCGHEVVYGHICGDACRTDGERAYRVDSLAFRAVPVTLNLPASSWFGQRHHRSRVASAYFARERALQPNLISAPGLASAAWCDGADPLAGTTVPLAIFCRRGRVTDFVDMWTARRERLEPPGAIHWQWRMAMRPLDAFLAQVLHFQCQLPDALTGSGDVPDSIVDRINDCLDDDGDLSADELIAAIRNALGRQRLFTPARRLPGGDFLTVRPGAGPNQGDLLRGGMVELPSAGWLPVAPGEPVEPQVRAIVGDGLDLRFCAVRHDFVPEAFWEAQHMDRIPLWPGLDDASARPEVDILVPDPEVATTPGTPGATALATEFRLSPRDDDRSLSLLSGVSRFIDETGRMRVASATTGTLPRSQSATGTVEHIRSTIDGNPTDVARRADDEHREFLARERDLRNVREIAAEFLDDRSAASVAFRVPPEDERLVVLVFDLTVAGDPLTALPGDEIPVSLRAYFGIPMVNSQFQEIDGSGKLVVATASGTAVGTSITGTLTGTRTVGGTTRAVQARMSVSIADDGTGRTLAIQGIPEPQGAVERSFGLVVKWLGDPVKGTVEVRVGQAGAVLVGGVTTAMDGRFQESAHVLVAGDQLHERASTAIDVVAALAGERKRAAELRRFILGEGERAPSQTRLVPTRDWVLFHRRRTKVCAVETPPPPPRPTPEPPTELDVVDVLVLPAKTEGMLEEFRASLVQGDPPLHLASRIMGAGFLAGSPVMDTPAAAVAQAVRNAVGPDRRLVEFAMVAPDATHRAGRIAALAGAFSVPPTDVVIVPDPASDHGHQGSDEVFVVVTGPTVVPPVEPDTELHRVFEIVVPARGNFDDTVGRMAENAKAQLAAGITTAELIRRLGADRALGEVTFAGEAVASDSLAGDRGSTFPEAYFLLASDPATLDPPLAESRAQEIGARINRTDVHSVHLLQSQASGDPPLWLVTRQVQSDLGGFPTGPDITGGVVVDRRRPPR